MILSRTGIIASSGGILYDVDALAFITAAIITDSTQKSAVNQLVVDLKSANIWSKMNAIYPFVGGTAFSHKFNLKDARDLDAAFRLVFAGGWTHSSTGALPNGTTAYADTKLVPSSVLNANRTHVAYYSRTNAAGPMADFGAFGSSLYENNIYAYIKYTDGKTYFRINRGASPESNIAIADSRLFYLLNRNLFYQEDLFTNTTKNSFYYNSSGLSPYSIYLAAINNFGTGAVEYSSRETAFASIGEGLTDGEALAFYNAVQAFNTTLARNI